MVFPLVPPPRPQGVGTNEWWGPVYLRKVSSLEESPRIYRCSRRHAIQESDNVVAFPFSVHITEQQPFKPFWSPPLLYKHEPSPASFAVRFMWLIKSFLRNKKNLYRSSLPTRASFRLVPTLVICPARQNLLVARLPPA